MNHMFRGAAIAALAALCAAPASAQTFAGGINVGTPGVGVEVQAKVNDMIVLRGDLDWLSLSHDETYSTVHYDGKARLLTGGVFADLHPGNSPLLISGGAYFGHRKLKLHAQPTANVTIGGVSYTPAQVGVLDGEAKLSNAEPFVGVGYDNTFVGERAWGFRALLGVSFSKKPDVHLTSTGGVLSADPTFQARLRQQEVTTEHDARKFRYYPVVQLGVTHRF